MRSAIVLVTANIGGIDPAFPLPPHPGVDALYLADFDLPRSAAATWDTVIRIQRTLDDARTRAKQFKCQIHRLDGTADYPFLAWADSCFRFNSLAFLPELASRIGESGTRAAFIPHPDRSTVAEEYDYILTQLRRGSRYLRARYDITPLHLERAHFAARHDLARLPLWCGGLWMLPNSPAARSFLDAWWQIVNTYSICDQTSIGPLLIEAGIEVEPFAVNLYRNEFWERVPHA